MSAVLCKASSKSLQGARVQRRAARPSRAVKVCAKYGEESKYFDLKDMTNTTASWDMYGVDDPKRYPGLQAEFFERAAEALTRREALRTFITVAGVGGVLTWGALGSKQAELAITKAPTKSENGKGGKFGRL